MYQDISKFTNKSVRIGKNQPVYSEASLGADAFLPGGLSSSLYLGKQSRTLERQDLRVVYGGSMDF